MARFLRAASRRRPIDSPADHGKGSGAELEKCLTTLDLISLGVGSCCGAGMYLTAGIIAAKEAGPGGMVSLGLAGLLSVLTGFHYAEVAGICPHTSGSAYMYTYVTVGELLAFIIGWGLVVEYVIGTAAAAVALSETFDSLVNKEISTVVYGSLHKAGLPHIDFVAALVCLVLTWLLASGVQMSARVNNALNGLNFAAWAVFVGAASVLGSFSNWTEHGGFLPLGYKGVLSAVPTAYYAFVGFDGLATTGAECKNPVKSIPVSIIISIVINIVIFVTVVLGLTINIPYSLLPADTAMLDMFAILGYPALKYVVAVGAVSGLFAATFGSLFPLPRVLQAMAHDGLFFRYFANVCPKRHTPLRATILSGLVATFLAAFMHLTLLIELVLIGTLLAYVIVTYVTLVIRFINVDQIILPSNSSKHSLLEVIETSLTVSCGIKRKFSDTNLKNLEDKSENTLTSASLHSPKSTSEDYEDGGIINRACEDEEPHVYPRKNSASSGSHPKRSEDLPASPTTVKSPKEYKETSYLFSQPDTSCHISEPAPPSRVENLAQNWSNCFTSLTLYLRQHVKISLIVFYGCLTVLCSILANLFHELERRNYFVIFCLAISMALVTSMSLLLMFIPQIKRSSEGFQAPLVPLLTVITAGVNIYLMTSLSWVTWLLFLGWLLTGLIIYVLYGSRRSSLNISSLENSVDLESLEMESLDSASGGETGKENSPLLIQRG